MAKEEVHGHAHQPKSWASWGHIHNFEITYLSIECIIITLYGLFVRLGEDASHAGALLHDEETLERLNFLYPFYQDIHVMMFIGFGFLMAYLKAHSWSSIGINFVISAMVIQIYILTSAFWNAVFAGKWWLVSMNLDVLIDADFCVASVLISYGAVLGKINSFQMLTFSIIETFMYSLNESIIVNVLHFSDIGGSVIRHVFGAYFGLAASWIVSPKEAQGHINNMANYYSNMFGMVGCIFLWIMWPSFNASDATGNMAHRAIINTVLSMSASCLAVFISSSLYRNGKFHMEHILNATLAGGIIVGTSAGVIITPWAAIILGAGAGIISCRGYEHLSHFLEFDLGLHDTAGVHNLHGIPGVLAGILSAIFIASLTQEQIGYPIDVLYPGRTAHRQAVLQLAGTAITLAISITSGLIVGFLLKSKFFTPPIDLFHDRVYWHFEFAEEDAEHWRSLNPKQTAFVRREKPIPLRVVRRMMTAINRMGGEGVLVRKNDVQRGLEKVEEAETGRANEPETNRFREGEAEDEESRELVRRDGPEGIQIEMARRDIEENKISS